MIAISEKTVPPKKFWERRIDKYEARKNVMIISICIIFIILTISVTVIGYSSWKESKKSAYIVANIDSPSLNTNKTTNITETILSLYLTNNGERDSKNIDVEILIINKTSTNPSTYSTYTNRSWMNIGPIKMQETKSNTTKINLTVGRYEAVYRIYENNFHISTYRQAFDIKAANIERSRLASEIPEFSDLLIPLIAIIVIFAIFKLKKKGGENGRETKH